MGEESGCGLDGKLWMEIRGMEIEGKDGDMGVWGKELERVRMVGEEVWRGRRDRERERVVREGMVGKEVGGGGG